MTLSKQKKPSLYPTDNGCEICHSPTTVVHHIYPGVGRRPISDREGCWVLLCPYHHNMSDHGVHFDRELDLHFRRDCQERWMRANDATVDDFIATFGESYL